MRKKIFLLLFLIVTFLKAQTLPYNNPNLTPSERATDLVSRLTLNEKVSLMVDAAPSIPRLGINEYNWWNEALHGVGRAGLATVFPQAIGLAATFDTSAVQETFDMVSDEARAKHHDFKRNGSHERYQGLTFWTPNINIFRDPRWGRGQETYGEDPYLTSKMGVAVVNGLQGNYSNNKYDKAHACAKHYAVHSGPEWNRHVFDAENISSRDLWETYLPAFKALVQEAGVKEVMCAYNRYEGEPCCANNQLLHYILREKWGFDGVIVSDCGAVSDFYVKGYHETHPDKMSASADAVLSGTDLECGNNYLSLVAAVEEGLLKEKELDVSLHRILKARFELGLMDDDELVSWSQIPKSVVNSDAHKDKALEMARKSMTLLKNENNTLPLAKNYNKIAVIGPNAHDSIALWGNYNGFPSHTTTILEGITEKLTPSQVIYYKGCNLVSNDSESDAGLLKEPNTLNIVSKVDDAEVIVFVGGISPQVEGEQMDVDETGFKGGDRTSIELPKVQRDLIHALKQTGKPVVLVLLSGSSLGIYPEANEVDAILQAWYPGQSGGTAVADVLFGDFNPAGRLPVTFYKNDSQLPDYEDYSMKGRTYRYFEGEALYPFGHGLSYTSFNIDNARLNKRNITPGHSVVLSFDIKNTGSVDGDEVVQVYVRNLQDKEGPLKSLRAFKRIHLKKDECRTVSIELPSKSFEFFDSFTEEMSILPGKYEVLYGTSSKDEDLMKVEVSINPYKTGS